MKRLDDRATRHDRFHKKAKQQGFLARAVFKLEELDQRFALLAPGARVLDLGCAPGSWLQYARTRVGATGVLVGLDRAPLPAAVAGARVVVGDVMTIDPAALRGELAALLAAPAVPTGPPAGGFATARLITSAGPEPSVRPAMFDVVLSDMAPDTSGIRQLDQARSEALFERALELATTLLAPGGHFVGKLFQGPDFKPLIEAVRARFATMKTAKPESSRQISIEQYVVGKGFRS